VLDEQLIIEVESLHHGNISHHLQLGSRVSDAGTPASENAKADRAAEAAKAAISAAAAVAGKPVPGDESDEHAAIEAAARAAGGAR